MDDWEIELKAGFLEEASQAISDNEQNFLELEKDPSNTDLVDKIFRLAHNLKGSAKAVGFSELGAFTHEFESVLLKIRNKELLPNKSIVNLLLRCNDHVRSFVDTLKENQLAQVDSTGLVSEIHLGLAGGLEEAVDEALSSQMPEPATQVVAEVTAESNSSDDEITLDDIKALKELEASTEVPPPVTFEPVTSLEDVVAEAPRVDAAPAPVEVSAAMAPVAVTPNKPAMDSIKVDPSKKVAAKPDESIRVNLSRIEMLLNYVGELVILEDVLKQQVADTQAPNLRKTIHQINKVTKDIQGLSMSLRMIPLQATFQKMQRIVRDTAGMLKKDVQLEIHGEGTEVDKSILESLSDPLVHIVRNAVDHGIESAERRIQSGKNPVGRVRLEAFNKAGQLYIEVEDDGGGIDPKKIQEKAKEKGVLKKHESLSDQDAINLVFHPGFSTKQEVSEVSGRGVGMDVVKTNIEALGGSCHIDSVVGRGSIFQVRLPLTLAIADALVILLGTQRFVVPLAQVHESVKLTKGHIHQGVGGEVMLYRDENLPLYRLGTLLGYPHTLDTEKSPIALVFKNNGRPFAVMVDDILSQQPIVMKELSEGMAFAKGYSGVTILGDGKPALILELPELVTYMGKSRPVQAPTKGAA